jgi:heterogeneous nuclear ribonucleoprotein F/H/epithelial splicing regulatory protein 1/2
MIQALEQFVGGYMNNNIQMQPGMAPPGHPQYGMYGAMQQGPYGQPPGYMGAPACGAPPYGGMQPPMQTMPPAAIPGAATGPAPGKASTLRMRGLPFRSTVDDVLRFFAGFHILPGGIVLGQKDGRPSGEAWVTFASPTEAQRALLGMNHKNIGNRYVELFAAA